MLNLTPVPRERYRVGVPAEDAYDVLLASDATEWGGSGVNDVRSVSTDPATFHGYPQSIEVTLPPLGALVLAPAARLTRRARGGSTTPVEELADALGIVDEYCRS